MSKVYGPCMDEEATMETYVGLCQLVPKTTCTLKDQACTQTDSSFTLKSNCFSIAAKHFIVNQDAFDSMLCLSSYYWKNTCLSVFNVSSLPRVTVDQRVISIALRLVFNPDSAWVTTTCSSCGVNSCWGVSSKLVRIVWIPTTSICLNHVPVSVRSELALVVVDPLLKHTCPS